MKIIIHQVCLAFSRCSLMLIATQFLSGEIALMCSQLYAFKTTTVVFWLRKIVLIAVDLISG